MNRAIIAWLLLGGAAIADAQEAPRPLEIQPPPSGAETPGVPPPMPQAVLDPVVVAAPPMTESSSEQVIPGRDFELRPRGRAADILRLVPGFVVSQHQGGGKAAQYFLRGFDADHGQGYTDLHFMIPETLKQVDVFKGPYIALVTLAIWGSPATAHPQNPPKSPEAAAVEKEVLQFREIAAQAVTAKDFAKLRAIYAESFTHTHGSGKMDGKDARIVAMLAADPAIENAPVEELSVRIFGAGTAIVTGKSPILNKQEGKMYDFRWIAVYVKTGGAWQLAASQATRLPVAQ